MIPKLKKEFKRNMKKKVRRFDRIWDSKCTLLVSSIFTLNKDNQKVHTPLNLKMSYNNLTSYTHKMHNNLWSHYTTNLIVNPSTVNKFTQKRTPTASINPRQPESPQVPLSPPAQKSSITASAARREHRTRARIRKQFPRALLAALSRTRA